MIEDIKKIINDGVLAPSGENCQPWKFQMSANAALEIATVKILNVPEADQSLYNFDQKGSYVAHGALLENISISAPKHGYATHIELFPSKNDRNLVAIVEFKKISSSTPVPAKDVELYEFLEQRCTNRKDHHSQKLSQAQKDQLVAATQVSGSGEVRILDDQASLDILGKALAVNEHILFENKDLHDFFYEHILWREDEQHKAGGFYIKTLEFLPAQLKAVKLFKNWGILNFLNKIGKVSRKIAQENAVKYAKSGALAVVAVEGNSPADFVHAGRIAERVWLTATKLGLAVQPCTGVLYFMERLKGAGIDLQGNEAFSAEHAALIRSAYADIAKTFGVEGKTLPMLFRIGYADAPSAKAMRMEADFILL